MSISHLSGMPKNSFTSPITDIANENWPYS
jgi:hypothetical protein